LFPDRSAYYDTLSHLYYRQGKYDEAIAVQQKAIDVQKEFVEKRAKMLANTSIRSSLNENDAKMLERLTDALNKMKSKTL
jgi:tetratricopeptide (TPR) repeat protein